MKRGAEMPGLAATKATSKTDKLRTRKENRTGKRIVVPPCGRIPEHEPQVPSISPRDHQMTRDTWNVEANHATGLSESHRASGQTDAADAPPTHPASREIPETTTLSWLAPSLTTGPAKKLRDFSNSLKSFYCNADVAIANESELLTDRLSNLEPQVLHDSGCSGGDSRALADFFQLALDSLQRANIAFSTILPAPLCSQQSPGHCADNDPQSFRVAVPYFTCQMKPNKKVVTTGLCAR